MATLKVTLKGARQLHRALKQYDNELKLEFERSLRDAGELVAADARSRFSGIDTRSATGFRPRLRGFGRVVVEQSRRRTTGKRGDYGALQMRRALLPAVEAKQPAVLTAMEHMLDTLGREFET